MRALVNSRPARRACALSVLLLLAMASVATAQPIDIPPTWGGSFWDRPRLTGSWFGLRTISGRRVS
jgi:hypothetical protein